MRTRNALERLAAVAPAVELPVDAEEKRILERILASPRRTGIRRRRRASLVLAGVAVLAAAGIAAALEVGNSPQSTPQASAHHRVALTGARIELDGYTFRTPAGYKKSSAPCQVSKLSPGSGIQSWQKIPLSGSWSASADGGCIQAVLLDGSSVVAAGATPVAVGPYKGFLATSPATQGAAQAVLFVEIPAASGDHYLALIANGLTSDQLVAIAESGLPTSIPPTTTTCTENCG